MLHSKRWLPVPAAALSRAATVTQVGAAVAALVAIGLVLSCVQRGFDFTDDAFYVLTTREPEAVAITPTLFGFVLHPLFVLVGGSIAAFRASGVLIACALAIAAGYAWCGEDRPLASRLTPFLACAAAMPLFYYGLWATSPSYNWLMLASGLLLFAAFGFLARSDGIVPPSLLAAGAGVIALLAKAPAAVLFGLLYAAAVAVTAQGWRPFLRRLAAAALATLCVLAASWLVLVPLGPALNSLTAFYDVLVRPGIYGLPSWRQIPYFVQDQAFPVVLVCGSTLCATMIHRAWFDNHRVLIAVIVAIAAASAYCAPFLIQRSGLSGIGVKLTALALIALSVSLVTQPPRHSLRPHALLALAVLIPWAAAIGSANPFWEITYFVGAVPAIVVLEAARRAGAAGSLLLPVGMLALLLLLGDTLASAVQNPYRLAAPLSLQRQPIEITPAQGTLRVDETTRRFIETLRGQAKAAGLLPGQPIFDLTGNPGLVLALDGRPPAAPWIISGRPMSKSLLAFVVNDTPPEVRRGAWVIWGDLPGGFDEATIKERGFDLAADYRCVARAVHPLNGGTVCVYKPAP